MSNQSGFDYDVLISRLHGGVRAFQSLRAHRRQRDQPPTPPPDERPPPTRPSPSHPDDPAEARAVSSLEPQAFIAMNGRMVPLFGDLGAGMSTPSSPTATMPPASSDTPPAPPRPAPSPAPEEPKLPTATAPAPAPSPLKLPLPTPPARLGLIYGGHPPPHTTSDGPATPSTNPDHAAPAKAQEMTAAIAALLDARAEEEALRLEKVHAEHRACITQLLQEHRNELRAQSEADAARTAQLLRDLLAEHRTELSRAAQTHADHLTQILAQHQQHPHTQHEPATPSDDALRSALLEQAKLQREVTEATAEHIGALTTIVADLGQTVGMLAVAAARGSSPAIPSPSQSAAAEPSLQAPPATTTHRAPFPADSTVPLASNAPPLGPPAPEHTRTSSGTPQPPSALITTVSPPTPASERARVLQCVDDDRDDDDLASADDDEAPPPRSRLHPITPLSASEDPGDD